ncbi:MAG TPA: hypothetical protein VHE13_01515 [Opitutus sp.]|nr:hypothetical protein [Opitutus sp.]
MRAFRAFFLSRLLREKVMLLAFVALGVAMWLTNFARRADTAWHSVRTLRSELAEQKEWLANRAAIEAGAEQAVKDLDPARTLDDTRLVSELSAMARDANLKFVNDTPQTDRSEQFAIHTVQITLSRADWEALKRFYLALERRSPYIGLEQLTLAADRAHPDQINAALRVSSVEIVR